MNKFNIGDIIRNNMGHNNFTYLVTQILPSVINRYQLLCLDTNQRTSLPQDYEHNYNIVARA